MVAAGSDVTFLVRQGRSVQLRNGQKFESPRGNVTVPVKTLTGEDVDGPFDVIILLCKAYGLTGALDAIAPHVSDGAFILPLLNGYAHIERLEKRFPRAIVLGGTAGVVATLTEDGTVRQMHPNQLIVFGLRQWVSDRHRTLEILFSEMKRADIDATLSSNIDQAMWEKWTFLATLSASTCLMRGSVGEILATEHGEALISGLFDECNFTADAEGHPPATSRA